MARSKTPTSKALNYKLPPNLKVPCVLQVNNNPFGGKGLGITTSIATSLLAIRSPDKESFLGFIIEFPLPTDSIGFGQCHHIDFSTRKASPSNTWDLTVKFPRDDINITYRAASEDETARYSAGKKHMTWVVVFLGNNASVSVQGFGIPYSNPGHPAEDWLRYTASTTVIGGLSFLDIIQQRHFSFLATQPEKTMMARWSVASLAPKFDYGYGIDQSWNMDRYMKQLHDVKGHRFQTTWNFGTDASHSKIMWIQKYCLDMTTEMGSAYFVKHPASRKSGRWLVIVKMDRDFWKHTEWSQACIHGTMKLVVHPGLLNRHPLTENDFVIRVIEPLHTRLGIKEFESREEANNRVSFEWDLQLHEAKRQVDAVCDLLPSAAPNHLFCDQRCEGSELSAGKKALMMSFHRDLLRGDGFWQTMMSATSAVDEMAGNMRAPNTGGQGQGLILPMLPSVSEADQCPLRFYLSNRPLGFGIITTGPNSNDTPVLPAAVLAMHATMGTVMASGPTPAAVNKFAFDLHTVSHNVVCKYNIGRTQETRSRAALVIRSFQIQVECDAFKILLRFPHLGDEAASDDKRGVKLDWNFHLSASYWLLLCLGSESLPPLQKDDSNILHEFKTLLAGSDSLARLRERVSGKISWEVYVAGETVRDTEIMRLMKMLVEVADIVCTTPSLAHTEDHLKKWKVERARGIAIDEAGRMSRGDLYSIWGNTLLPCLLAGNEEFIPLEVKSYHDRDDDGNMRNRFGDDARKSALEFLTATGWPVYRVRGQ
ncbi:uncharacterized protein FFUJ_05242 [Fusarium fujikuroi IMI 58289]|uniref:Uncharacterized protein n=1 Tax=Gibberella fujikuroi (strain CBS 195.34 / IMI 58289 / NRRL A-6831) TaxID=1279085 RepID=S0DME3_GIBF5|nr:uncharacterized protein FFUJ_05242 [Fusarium fujikuroi IMI 58289]CCT63610.1 uncharacterized protein FFUJ_05242 [Fusarium fujikuroi IMI 58289]SCN98227.1 uncharacterized protein FFM5_06755 [Fusarium fujikuroi]SCO43704.1 uncharacterized protein FFNC_09333 [Fusarium fujikuroi]